MDGIVPAASTAQPKAPLIAVIGAMASLYLIWGSTYFGIRVAIETMPPLLMAGVRFLLAGLILYALAAFRGQRHADRPTLRQWLSALLIGVCLIGIGNGGITWAEQYVPSGIVALLVATVPLWMALFSWLLGQERLSRMACVGLLIGLAGVALLLRPSGHSSALGVGLVLLSPLAWAAGSLYARSANLPKRQLVGSAMEMIMGGLVLCIAAALQGELSQIHVDKFSTASVLSFAYLIVFGSIVGFSCYSWLLHELPTSIVATYAYVNPVVAVGLGAAFLGEAISIQALVAGGLVVIAVALILGFPAKPRPGDRGVHFADVA